MRKTLSFSCLLVSCCSLCAQTVNTPSSMRYTGIGTYSRHFADVFSVAVNQASICNLPSTQAGLYTEQRFMLQELTLVSGAIAIPMHNSGVGLVINRFGFTGYNETQVGLAYGKKLSNKVDLGVQFDYNTLMELGYGSASAVNVEIGTIWHLTEKLHMGIHIYNPTGSKYDKNSGQKLPPVCTMGFGYDNGHGFFVSTEIAKEADQPVNVNVGVHYAFEKQFFLRFGIATGTSNSFAGVGLKWDVCRMDVSVSYNPQLGFTPALSLLFSLKKQTTESK